MRRESPQHELSPLLSRRIRQALPEARFPHPRQALLGSFALIAGLLLQFAAGTEGRKLGLVVFVAGAGGLAHWNWRFWRAWNFRQELLRERRRRSALRVKRQERSQRESRQRRQYQDAQKVERQQQTARREQARLAEQQARTIEAHFQREKQRNLEEYAVFLSALSDKALLDEIKVIFEGRGMRCLLEEGNQSQEDSDLLFAMQDETRIVVRCVPIPQRAGRTDVLELEALRQQVGAKEAYLVALAGFSPPAVHLVRDLPMTLTEAHLLASWKVSG